MTNSTVASMTGERAGLSTQQEIVWFHQRLLPDSRAYHFTTVLDVTGELDRDCLIEGLRRVVAHHPALRTAMADLESSEPYQWVAEHAEPIVVEHDLRGIPEPDAELPNLIARHVEAPFELGRPPLFRWLLVRVGERRYQLVHTEHHLIHDGRSFTVILGDLFTAYRELRDGREVVLTPARSYLEYVRHCASQAYVESVRRAGLWWRDQLAGAQFGTTFRALARHGHERQGHVGAQYRQTLPADLLAALGARARTDRQTVFAVLFGLFAELLRRHADQHDVVIGTAVGNCPAGFERTVGMMVNTLPIRVRHESTWTGRDLVDSVMDRLFDAIDRGNVPIQHIVRDAGASTASVDNSLIRVMFSMHDSPLPDVSVPDLGVDLVEGVNNSSARFDIDVVAIPGTRKLGPRSGAGTADEALTLVWDYSIERFDAEAVALLAQRFERLLRAYLAAPTAPVRSLTMDDEPAYPPPGEAPVEPVDLADFLPAAVLSHGDQPAVRCGAVQLSYRELAERVAVALAALTGSGLQPGHVVAVALPRGIDAIVFLLACLRGGFVFAPLATTAPRRRLVELVERLRPAVLVAESIDQPRPDVRAVPVIPAADPRPVAAVPAGRQIDAAYIIHTSGSTGTPKSVAVPRAALSVAVAVAAETFEICPDDRVLQFSDPAFDVYFEEVLPSLVRGATLVVPRAEIPTGSELAAALLARGVTVANLPTGYLAGVLTDLESALDGRSLFVRLLILGGERLPGDLVRRLVNLSGKARILNAYGVTEATITSTVYECRADSLPDEVPIGRPLPGAEVLVLDGGGRPQPCGVPGELAIGGVGATCWYLDDPAQTAERFRELAPGGRAGRYFVTGDLGYVGLDGELRFAGRGDRQVKLRGYRIELEEIEVVASRLLGASTCAVVLDESPDSGPRLVGYTAHPDVSAVAELSRRLAELLPQPMVPALWVSLDRLPRDPASGKVDIAALHRDATTRTARPRPATDAPSTDPLVGVLVEGCRELLDNSEFGADDDFFAAGGHSLLAVKFTAWIEQRTGTRPPLRLVFEHPRPRDLARVIGVIRGDTAG